MQVTKNNLSDTKVQLVLTADEKQLAGAKKAALTHLAKDVRMPGFRQGKAPANLVEKNLNPATLQTEFLDRAVNMLYITAVYQEKLHPVAQPEVKINKFVPFETLEVEVTVEAVGEIQLPDYTKTKRSKKPVTVTAAEVEEVLARLKKREAQRKDVERAAKKGDQVYIDFKGVDAQTKDPINGADGKEYPLLLGSNTFIPGFEDKLIGMKKDEEKTFTVTFPKDYGVKVLQERKVAFTVKIIKVQDVIEPELDDTLAAKAGPFKTVAELKTDIKKQLHAEKEQESTRSFTDELITEITNNAKVAIPEVLINEQIDRLIADQKQNLVYRGQTWQEFLEGQGLSEEDYRKQLRPDAELRAKAGLVLAKIAEKEKIEVVPEELEARLKQLKGQYPDKQMQAELAKPEARREISSRIISEKTIAKLTAYAEAK